MKKTSANLLLLSGLLFFCFQVKAQNNFFTDVKESSCKIAGQQRVIVPQKYRTLLLDTTALSNFFKNLPSEKNSSNHGNAPVIAVPLPNGSISHFHLWESSIMEPALAAKFPDIKTYTGQGIEDSRATIKIDWTGLGFHAMILSSKTSAVFIDPYAQGTKNNYISYFKSDFKATEKISEPDITQPQQILNRPAAPSQVAGVAGLSVGTQLRTFRLAVACTHQYAIAATGSPTPTVNATLAAIIVSINRVDGIYETELAMHLTLVANENAIIFTNSGNDPLGPYNSQGPDVLFGQAQILMDANIGDANYDVGETFSTGAGGGSYIGVVCQSGSKASSAVGVTHPVGDPFNVDYVAHEIGHEFGAHHPFNSDLDFCGHPGQDYIGTNDEPGSASTIMGYSGSNTVNGILCSTDNLQPGSDPYFNGINFDEIINFVTSGQGSNCAVTTATVNHATTNHPPNVAALTNHTIPFSTPFILTGSATDPDGDSLTYCWEQVDVGGVYCAWNAPVTSDFGDAPLFRSFLPDTIPVRYFPKLSDVINNTTTIGEIMPQYARTMHFRLTARDNQADGGGVSYSGNAITVDGGSGPFKVTYPDTAGIVWKIAEFHNVTWDPAGTAASLVNCSNVTIQLSVDGGLTYPYTLVGTTPNTGTAQVQVPNAITTNARVRVMAVGNIFYDISNNNFIIKDSAVPVTWVNFSATKNNNNAAVLSWTVDEVNVKSYVVQRSFNGTDDFKSLDTILSKTGNGQQQQYSTLDNFPIQGTDYYRIEEINTDGSFTFSSIQPITFGSVSSAWSIYYPNANIGIVQITSNAGSSNAVLQLFDAAGKLVYESATGSTMPGQVINISLGKFPRGMYTLKINSAAGVKHLHLLKW